MYSSGYEKNDPLLAGHGGLDELRSKLAPSSSSIAFEAKFENNLAARYSLSDREFIRPSISPICYFLSADRLGPQVSLPVEQRVRRFPTIGPRGEYVIGFLEVLRNFIVHDSLRHQKAQGLTLEYQLVAWMSEIAPGVEISFQTDRKRDSAYFEFNTFRPLNVGFGLSYCLPILAAALGLTSAPPASGWKDTILGEDVGIRWAEDRAERGVLLLIENPEAHLHPKGQTALGKFIAKASMCGVQFVIETQSDHLMDGIRIAVKEASVGTDPKNNAAAPSVLPHVGHVTPQNVIFHYLEKDLAGRTVIQTPILESTGKLSSWPEGFFDQTLKNRTILAR